MQRRSLNEVTNILENLGRQDEAANRVLKPDELIALFRDRRTLLRHRDALIPCWSDKFEGQIRFICDQYRSAGVDDRRAMKSLVGFGARSALLRFAAHMTTIAMQTKDAVALDLALVALDFSNAISRDWRDIYTLISRMVSAAGRCSVNLTDRTKAVIPDAPPELLQVIGFAKPAEVDSDSEGKLVWRRYEQVLAVTDYNDGPRRGVANYKGEPHFFDRIFDKPLGAYSDRYRLTPLPYNVFQLFREDHKIWNSWRRSLEGTPPSASIRCRSQVGEERFRRATFPVDCASEASGSNATRRVLHILSQRIKRDTTRSGGC